MFKIEYRGSQHMPTMKMPIFLLNLLFIASLSQGYAQATSLRDVGALFRSEEPLEMTLTGDVASLFSDRIDPEATYFDFELSCGSDQVEKLPVRVKTRGNFRRISGNCAYPPIRLNFEGANLEETSVFFGEGKLKLVMPCRGEKYVHREYIIYKLYNLLTP